MRVLTHLRNIFYSSLLVNQGIDSVNKCVYVHTIYYLPLIFCLNKCKFHADRYLDSWIGSFKLRGEDCPLLSFLWWVALEANRCAGGSPLAHQPAVSTATRGSRTVPFGEHEGLPVSVARGGSCWPRGRQGIPRDAGYGSGSLGACRRSCTGGTCQPGVFQPAERLEEGPYAVCEHTACIYGLISTDMVTTHW